MTADSQLNPQAASTPGFPCPRCGAQIYVELTTLLRNASLHCANCQLELQIDLDQSAAGLQALRKLNAQMEAARQTLDQIKRTGRV